MRCISIPEPGRVETIEQDIPVPANGEALLKLRYGGICGSDVGTYKGTFLYAGYPRIPGHEFSAEIMEIEENDSGLTAGMTVTCNPYFNCGTCYSCRRGYVNCCVRNQTMGAQRDGAFREYITMPVERIYDARSLSAKTAALIEPFCIGHHAVKRAAVGPEDRVLVVGAGSIGLFAALSAKLAGARVFVSDVAGEKLDRALEFGLDGAILNTGEREFSERTEEITGGDGFDVCIEAVGLPSTFMSCLGAAAFRGRVVIIGIGKTSLDFHYSIIQTKELDIFGSRNALKADFLELIDLAGSGVYDLERVVTNEYPLEEAAGAFSDLSAGGNSMLKVMIRFS